MPMRITVSGATLVLLLLYLFLASAALGAGLHLGWRLLG